MGLVRDRYVLLGCYENDTRPNVEVLDSSDDYHELENAWNLIEQVNVLMTGLSMDEPPEEAQRIMSERLAHINMWDTETGYVESINVLGIFEVRGPVRKGAHET